MINHPYRVDDHCTFTHSCCIHLCVIMVVMHHSSKVACAFRLYTWDGRVASGSADEQVSVSDE